MYKGELLPFARQLMGFSRWVWPVPLYFWRRQRDSFITDIEKSFNEFTGKHQQAYRLALVHLVTTNTPLEIMDVAAQLGLTIDRTEEIIDDLEKRTGLVKRNRNGSIVSAYPVTLDKSRGRFISGDGEEMGADGPLNTLALTPVIARIKSQDISGHFTTECSCCRRGLHFIVRNDLDLKWLEKDTDPCLFMPLLADKTGTEGILFCLSNAVWYCSEEHARESRNKTGGVRGYYLTPETAADLMNRLMGVIYPRKPMPI
jgi:hypothetical protein